MAITKLFQYIGARIKEANPWIDNYAVNAIQLPNKLNGTKGEVVNFVGEEKEYLGIDDTKGSAFYIRTNPIFSYVQQRQLTSCTPDSEVTVQFKFVFFAINQKENYDPLKLENLFSNNFRTMNFSDYGGNERKIKLIVKTSNADAYSVFTEEIGKKYEFGANSVFVAINAELKFLSSNECEDCGIYTSVDILNTFDFCDPEVIARLCFIQKECLREEFSGEGGLTCEQLPDCPVIINHEERIEALEDSPPSGLTCADLPGCAVIINHESRITALEANSLTCTTLAACPLIISMQSDIAGKEPAFTVLPISKGGTNSGTALNNNRIIVSSGGAIIEHSAITADRVLFSDANGIPTFSALLTYDPVGAILQSNIFYGFIRPFIGSAAVNTAPIKLIVPGAVLLAVTEVGAIEAIADTLHYTITTGAVRKTVAFVEDITGSGTVELAPVISILNTPPGGPTTGDRYLVGTAPTGAWVGFANNVAEWSGAAWVFTAPVLNNIVYVTSTLTTYRWNGSAWIVYPGVAILQNGNALGATMTIGTNDAFNLNLKTNNIIRVTIGDLAGLPSIFMGSTAPSATNYILKTNGVGSTAMLNASINLQLLLANTTRLSIASTSSVWSDQDVHFAGIAINGTTSGLRVKVASSSVTSANLGANGGRIRTITGTITDSSALGTRALMVADSFLACTFNSSNAVTVTDAYTAYIDAPPIDGGANITFTRSWALGIASGDVNIGGNISLGQLTTVPLARLDIGAGTTALSQINLGPGVAPTTPNDGDLYYVDTNDRLMFRKNALNVEIISASAVTTEVVVSDTTLTVTYNGVTYKLLARA